MFFGVGVARPHRICVLRLVRDPAQRGGHRLSAMSLVGATRTVFVRPAHSSSKMRVVWHALSNCRTRGKSQTARPPSTEDRVCPLMFYLAIIPTYRDPKDRLQTVPSELTGTPTLKISFKIGHASDNVFVSSSARPR
jgi:hypothetical protein